MKDNALRRSILFNAKADIISYGMGDKSMPELADALRDGKEWKNIKGLCYISKAKPEDAPELASFEECKADKVRFFKAFSRFYKNKCPKTPEISAQKTC